jgi:hypothetical protein
MNDQKDIKEDLARLLSSQRPGGLATQDQGAPCMSDFARFSSSAPVEIRVEKHILVKRFQEVFEPHVEK